MMIKTRRDELVATGERGLGLIEVLVAMMIFALVAVGIVHSLIAVTVQVRDSKAREVATNLASEEIDAARATDNLFTLLDWDYPPVTIGGQEFYVTRSADWVTDPDADSVCGGSTGATTRDLQYKRVSVTVSWNNIRDGARPVYADTLIAPAARVSGPARSTILVYVESTTGAGAPGVSIATTPAITPAPKPTDAEGCTYISGVTPGTYSVTISDATFIDAGQEKPPTQSVTVQAGEAGSAFFRAAPEQPLTLNYASNFAGAVTLPDTLTTSFLHASDPVHAVDADGDRSRTQFLYPFAEGYKAVAGRYLEANDGTAGCLSANPAEWPTTVEGTQTLESPELPEIQAAVDAEIDVPMGVVRIAKPGGVTTITAVSQATAPPGTADPGCASLTMTYTFSVSTGAAALTAALPFGSWQIHAGPTAAARALTAELTLGSRGAISPAGIVTLDPREVV